MITYAQEIDAYGSSYDDNPARHRKRTADDTEREIAENLRRAIGDTLWLYLEDKESEIS